MSNICEHKEVSSGCPVAGETMLISQPCGTAQFYPWFGYCPPNTQPSWALAPLSSKGCRITMLKATLTGRAHTRYCHFLNRCNITILTDNLLKRFSSKQSSFFLDHHNDGIVWPIARTGWIDILFKSEPPHLQIIHNASWYCPDTVAHPRLPCHTPTIFYPTPRITLFVKRYMHHAYMHLSQGHGYLCIIHICIMHVHPGRQRYTQLGLGRYASK